MTTFRYKERINVVYTNGVKDKVGSALLTTLLKSKMIDQFVRFDGWAELGIDPIRGMGGPTYEGSDSRLN